MKRPISILCLADIHYEKSGDMAGLDTLCKELKSFTDENAKWRPDYIVIAGDIANKNKDYTGAECFISGLMDKFGLGSEDIIMVPGNHDNEKTSKKKEMQSQKTIFDEYCQDPGKNKEEFGNKFAPKFHKFVDFNKKYIDNGDYSKFYPQSKNLDERLRGLSGVKFFEKDHLCFVYVNTEWLYLLDKKNALKSLGDKADYVKVDENCRIIGPLIKDAYTEIKKNYPDYTVVTVMHRGFDHFSWEEKNMSDASKIDTMAYIKSFSDIIITGHDHVFRPAPPTLIDNRIQYFQLGSVGRKESLVSELSRFGEIIRIDVPNGEIEQLFIQYKNDNSGNHYWDFNPSDRVYPLYTKYKYPNYTLSQSSHTILRVPSLSEDDIRKSILLYFNISSNDTLIVHAGELNDERKRNEVKETSKKFIIVYHDYMSYGKNTKTLDKIRDEMIEKILLNKVVIEEVLLEYPVWDNDEYFNIKNS